MQKRPEDYYEKLPAKRMAVGVILLDENSEVLIVKPTYKDNWSIPGGVVDQNESLKQARIREVKEELNLEVKTLKLLCVDYMSPEVSEYENKNENLQFIFYGGVLSPETIRNIKLSPEELSEFKFVKKDKVSSYFRKNLKNRMPRCLEALEDGTVYYLEGGKKV